MSSLSCFVVFFLLLNVWFSRSRRASLVSGAILSLSFWLMCCVFTFAFAFSLCICIFFGFCFLFVLVFSLLGFFFLFFAFAFSLLRFRVGFVFHFQATVCFTLTSIQKRDRLIVSPRLKFPSISSNHFSFFRSCSITDSSHKAARNGTTQRLLNGQ